MSKRKINQPTEAEDKAILKGIAADPDTMELGEDFFARAKPARRGKQKAPTKVPATVRYSPVVLKTYRGLGKGWQTQLDTDLQEIIERKYTVTKKGGVLITTAKKAKGTAKLTGRN